MTGLRRLRHPGRQRRLTRPLHRPVPRLVQRPPQPRHDQPPHHRRIAVFDILNQNRGFDRTGDATRIVENNYLAIRRYGMLSLIWNITNQPVKEGEDDE